MECDYDDEDWAQSRAHIGQLPFEILEHILKDSSLHARDVLRFTCTCKQFKCVEQSSDVWKTKLHQRWPSSMDIFSEPDHNWTDEYRQRHIYGKKVYTHVDTMSYKYFAKEEVSSTDFAALSELIKGHPHGAMLVFDALVDIFEEGDSGANMTVKYYCQKAMRFVQHTILKKDWAEFLSTNSENQLLETGAVLLSRWCQPTIRITESEISRALSLLADEVRLELSKKDAGHPAIKHVDKELAEVQVNSWSPLQCRIVLETLNYVMFEKNKFQGNSDDYYNPQNSFVNKVLEKRLGIPVSLSIVYASVARRLGVICEPVNFPSHFLLRWHEHPELPASQEYTYIDVFSKGKFMNEYECRDILSLPFPSLLVPESFKAIQPYQVIERMARNLVNIGRQMGRMDDGLLALRTAVELSVILNPNSLEHRIQLARIYLHLEINLSEVVDDLQSISSENMDVSTGLLGYLTQSAEQMLQETSEEPQPIVSKLREKHKKVKYSVGLIMKHLRYDYTCVIYGWDEQCEATKEWILQMGVHNLPNKQHQPFYNVLVEDGSNRYAAQESLKVADEPKFITHPVVGKYFRQYCGTHYLPNEEKAKQYPQDVEATLQLIQQN